MTIAEQLDAIRKTRLIAKAVFILPDDSTKIVAVYQDSTYYYYFHHYSAKSPRTPRKHWKAEGWGMLYAGFTDDLQTYAERQARIWKSTDIRYKWYLSKKKVESLRQLLIHPPTQTPAPGQTFLITKKQQHKLGIRLTEEEHRKVKSLYAGNKEH